MSSKERNGHLHTKPVVTLSLRYKWICVVSRLPAAFSVWSDVVRTVIPSITQTRRYPIDILPQIHVVKSWQLERSKLRSRCDPERQLGLLLTAPSAYPTVE